MFSWPLRFLLPVVIPMCFALSACMSHIGKVGTRTPPVKSSYTVERDIVYTPKNWPEAIRGDLYRPELATPAPAVLLLHYGGWTGDDHRNHMAPIARKLAERGYVVFNVTYRKAPRWVYPAQIEDLHQALAWMRGHAREKGIDSDRIATYGYSAGGHLASLVGLMKHPYNEQIKAVVAGGDPADLTMAGGPGMVADFLGGTKDRIPERYLEASPLNHVTADSPPVFLYHGTMDTLVPPEHVRRFSAELDRRQVPHEVYWLKGRGHITAFLFPGRVHEAAIDFLDRVLRKNG